MTFVEKIKEAFFPSLSQLIMILVMEDEKIFQVMRQYISGMFQ